jgi:biopolymer transport protein ExbD
MGMSSRSGRGGLKSDINITPLVDVVLVLLIICMVAVPELQRGQDVQLPRAHRADPWEKSEPLILSVTQERKLFVASEAYADNAAFQARLQEEVRQRPGRKILLKADQSLACGDVRKVIRLARVAGVERLSFGVEVPEPK